MFWHLDLDSRISRFQRTSGANDAVGTIGCRLGWLVVINKFRIVCVASLEAFDVDAGRELSCNVRFCLFFVDSDVLVLKVDEDFFAVGFVDFGRILAAPGCLLVFAGVLHVEIVSFGGVALLDAPDIGLCGRKPMDVSKNKEEEKNGHDGLTTAFPPSCFSMAGR